jgi:hypothetical protein
MNQAHFIQTLFESICDQLDSLCQECKSENFIELKKKLEEEKNCSKAQLSVIRSMAHSCVSARDFFCSPERVQYQNVERNLDTLLKEFSPGKYNSPGSF